MQTESEVGIFLIDHHASLVKLSCTTDSIGKLDPEIRADKGLQKQYKTKKLPALFGCILKSQFARSDSFAFTTSQMLGKA